MKSPEPSHSSGPIVALTVALAASGCVSETHLSRLDPSGNGPSDSASDPLDHVKFNPAGLPDPFTLGDLTRNCIPEPIDCPPGDEDCSDINAALSLLGTMWAERLEAFYGEPVDPGMLRAGAYDDRMQATGYVHADTDHNKDERTTHSGGIFIAGDWSRESLSYMMDAAAYPDAQLKCGSFLTHDVETDAFKRQSLRAGFTAEDTHTWLDQIQIDQVPGSIQGQSDFLYIETGEPGYSAVLAWIETGRSNTTTMGLRMAALDPMGQLDGDTYSEFPIATTELTE